MGRPTSHFQKIEANGKASSANKKTCCNFQIIAGAYKLCSLLCDPPPPDILISNPDRVVWMIAV